MKNKLFYILVLFSLIFTGCELLSGDFYNATPTNKIEMDVDFSVYGFSQDSVVLQWSTEETNVRYNIYVKNKDRIIERVKANYGKTDYFVKSDDQSSYAVGVLMNDKEVYRTDFVYPDLAEGKGFPANIGIADDGYLGVECLYPSNVDKFSLKGEKENGETYHTKKYSAEELNHYLLPIRYKENSHNNYFVLIFTIDETEYKSAPYYFDYAHHEQAVEAGKGKYIKLYPSL
jgi:hypothetical protein